MTNKALHCNSAGLLSCFLGVGLMSLTQLDVFIYQPKKFFNVFGIRGHLSDMRCHFIIQPVEIGASRAKQIVFGGK